MRPLAFCSISALDRPIAAVAEMALACGVEAIEITGHAPHLAADASVAEARDVGRAVRATGCGIVAFGSYLGRFGQVTADDARRAVAWTEALETPLLRVWAEPLPDDNQDKNPTVDLMRAACDAALPAGITVVVERHLGSFADTPRRIADLFAAIDRPNVALNYQVLDFLPPSKITQQAADAAALSGAARYFHLKNYQLNPDGQSAMLPGGSLADGTLDYRAILTAAHAAGYRGPLTIEFLAADERSVEAKLKADVDFVRSVLGPLA